MFSSKILNIYISTEFIKIIFNVAFGCFCLGTTMNLLEEINFFKDYDVGIMIPFYALFYTATWFRMINLGSRKIFFRLYLYVLRA